MKSEDKNPKSHVSWCWKQKRGIKLEKPSDNLCKAYIEKAKSALNMLDSAIEKDEIVMGYNLKLLEVQVLD